MLNYLNRSLYINSIPMQPLKHGFQIAMRWRNNTYDTTKASMRFFQKSLISGSDSASYSRHENEACTVSHFPAELSAQLETLDIGTYR